MLAVLAVFVAILVLPASSATGGTPAAADVACARARTSEPTGLKAGAHPVVLVHGWTGSVLTETRTALEKKMTPGWQFLLFDYHDASTQSADSPQISTCLGRYILEVSKAHHGADGDGIVYLVGHSMGGLAARFAADQTIDYEGVSERVGDHIGGLVTLDTPHAGSPWGNTRYAFLKEIKDGVALAAIPRDGSRARVCLATHVGGKGLPSGCVAAPYLPRAVPIHEIAGQGTIRRTFFGIHAYDLPLGGDAIVRSGSQQGYIGSGPASGPSSRNKVGLSTVSCQGDDGALIAEAATLFGGAFGAVLGAFAQMGSDTAVLDATISNTANPGAALLLLTADAALPCSHSRMTTNDQAITATAQALRRFADSRQTSCVPAPPTQKNPGGTGGDYIPSNTVTITNNGLLFEYIPADGETEIESLLEKAILYNVSISDDPTAGSEYVQDLTFRADQQKFCKDGRSYAVTIDGNRINSYGTPWDYSFSVTVNDGRRFRVDADVDPDNPVSSISIKKSN